MTGVLYGLARFCVRRKFIVLGVWLVAAIALVAISHRMGDNTSDNLSLPGTGSQEATETLQKSFPDQANGTSPIVLHPRSGKLTDSGNANVVNQAPPRRRGWRSRRAVRSGRRSRSPRPNRASSSESSPR